MASTKSKEHQIVFQNQSHLAIKYFELLGIPPTLKDIGLATDLMVRFCSEGYTKELGDLLDRFDEYISDQYRGGK